MEASRAEIQQTGHLPGRRQETALKLVCPQESEGFSLPELTDPSELAHGDVAFETFSGKASIARAKINWNYHVPESFTRDASLIIAHGLGAKQGAYSGLAKYLASHGIATAEYKAAHYQDLLAGLHPKHVFDASRLLYQAPWGVIRDIQSRNDIDGPIESFSMVGHSLGGRTAVKNAHRHPDTIDNVIAIDSIGLENHHLPGLALRLPGFFHRELGHVLTGKELSIEEKARLLGGGVVYFAENPWRGAGEIWSLSKDRIGDDIADLSELGKGTAIVTSPQDTLVHTNEEEGKKSDIFVPLPKIPDKKLDHLGPIRHPEVYGRTIVSLLNHLDYMKQ